MEGGVWTQTHKVDYSVACKYTEVYKVHSCNGMYNKNFNLSYWNNITFVTPFNIILLIFQTAEYKCKLKPKCTTAGISLSLQLHNT
jgi:hypothetical protein